MSHEPERAFEEAIETVEPSDVERALATSGAKARTLLTSGAAPLVRVGKRALLLRDMLAEWWGGEGDTPWRTISVATGALLYFVLPADVIPDPIPLVGFVDDASVLALGFRLLREDLLRYAAKHDLDLDDLEI